MIREYDFDRIRTRHGIAKIPFSIEFVPIKWDYARLDLIKQCWIVQTCILLDPFGINREKFKKIFYREIE